MRKNSTEIFAAQTFRNLCRVSPAKSPSSSNRATSSRGRRRYHKGCWRDIPITSPAPVSASAPYPVSASATARTGTGAACSDMGDAAAFFVIGGDTFWSLRAASAWSREIATFCTSRRCRERCLTSAWTSASIIESMSAGLYFGETCCQCQCAVASAAAQVSDLMELCCAHLYPTTVCRRTDPSPTGGVRGRQW